VQAASIAIDTDNAAAVWNWKFFENSARPNMAIEVPTAIDSDTRERLESGWSNKFKGTNNSHKPVFLTGGMKISDFGPSQKEMDFVEARKYSRDEIFAIFKVPKACIGLGEGASGNLNIKPFETMLMKNAVQPLAVKIQEVISIGLFGSIGQFEFINVVPQDSDEVRKDFESGGITLNEFRAAR
jgi:HK97 family phage portal protein